MNQHLLEIQRYFEEKYQFEMPVRNYSDGEEYLNISYSGEPPLKRRLNVDFTDRTPYIRLHSLFYNVRIAPEKQGEAFELINYIHGIRGCVRLWLKDGIVWIFGFVPKETPLSELGPVCEKLAQEIRDLFWKYDAQFRLLSAPADPAPAPAETKKRSANDPDERWSVDFG